MTVTFLFRTNHSKTKILPKLTLETFKMLSTTSYTKRTLTVFLKLITLKNKVSLI